MTLVATRPVLYRSTQYRAGDALPADNQAMVEAWLEAKSAKWKDETADAKEKSVESNTETQPDGSKTKKPPAKKGASKGGK